MATWLQREQIVWAACFAAESPHPGSLSRLRWSAGAASSTPGNLWRQRHARRGTRLPPR